MRGKWQPKPIVQFPMTRSKNPVVAVPWSLTVVKFPLSFYLLKIGQNSAQNAAGPSPLSELMNSQTVGLSFPNGLSASSQPILALKAAPRREYLEERG